jgi:hypothetical protein
MNKYRTLSKLSFIIFSTLFVPAVLINDNNVYANLAESNENQTTIESSAAADNTANSKPMIFVEASCMVGSPIIPGDFTGTGFTPNTTVIVEANQNNSTIGQSTEPVTILLSKATDQAGNITGKFNLNTQIQQPSSFEDYFLHIYSLDDLDEEPVVLNEHAIASLDIC